MHIQVKSDNHVRVDTAVIAFIQTEARHSLSRFQRRLTRVEFHLSDLNSHKFGPQDKRCSIEARPAGHPPVAVKMTSGNFRAAIHGSLEKLRTALDRCLARADRSVAPRRSAA